MGWLDSFVGRGRWVLALSADHGVMTAPEYLREQGLEAWHLTGEQARATRQSLNRLADATDAAARADMIAETEALPFVGDVITLDELSSTTAPSDSFIPLLRNAWVPDRSATSLLRQQLLVRNEANTVASSSDAGSHGSPYYYDRHVPLAFMGPGIRPGISVERASTVDLAPTLAALLGVPVPDGLDGVSRAAALRR